MKSTLQKEIRKMMKQEWWGNINARLLYIHFLGTQNDEGEMSFSIRGLSQDLGITERGVRSALKALENVLTHSVTHKGHAPGHTVSSISKGISIQSQKHFDTQVTHGVTHSTKRNQPRVKKEFSPPTLEQVKAYFRDNGYKMSTAETARKYYNSADWHDSYGRQVLNWKQKMLSVWFTEEHKEPSEQYVPPSRRIERLTPEEMRARKIERGIIKEGDEE